MTAESGMERLWKDVLALQDEDGRGAALAEERVREVLSGRDAFTAEEEFLLTTSPLARSVYAEVVEDLRLEEAAFVERFRRAGIDTVAAYPLAASSGGEPLEMSNADFTVRLQKHPSSEEWIVSVILSDRVRDRKIISAGDWLTLVDDQGVTWLRGQVNTYGEIHSYGLSCAEELAQRVRMAGFRLRVRPG
jgi:hypothetical protein